jgi:hypothetical protein
MGLGRAERRGCEVDGLLQDFIFQGLLAERVLELADSLGQFLVLGGGYDLFFGSKGLSTAGIDADRGCFS